MAFSFFFRDLPILESAVNFMHERFIGQSRIRVWDAGCAMGYELFTLSMLLAEKFGHFGYRNLIIHATDIEKEFGDIIRKAEYNYGDIERIPQHFLEKYFTKSDNDIYTVTEHLRSQIEFHHHDLLTLRPVAESLSLIICKNVLLHLQPEERISVLRMFHHSLAPGGILATENTQKMPAELEDCFELLCNDAQVFRKREVNSCA